MLYTERLLIRVAYVQSKTFIPIALLMKCAAFFVQIDAFDLN